MADTKKVGAQIIVEGADVAAQNFEQVAKAQADFTAGTEKLSQALNENQQPLDALQQRLHALPEAYQEAALKINASGVRAGTALTAVEEAMKNGTSAAQINAQADEMLAEKMTTAAAAADTQRAALNDDTDATKANVAAKKDLQDQSIKVGLAFFAMSIAARGLRDIGRELGHVYGQEVAQGFSTAADALQTIGSFGSGGALIGSLFGPAGTIAGAGIGGSIGALSAIGTILLQLPPEVEALNTSLDALGKKDTTIQTLSKILDISTDESKALLDIAKNSPEAAQALDKLAREKEPISELQLALEGVGKAVEDIINVGKGIDPSGQGLRAGVGVALDRLVPGLNEQLKIYESIGEKARQVGATQAQAELDAAVATQKQTEAITAQDKVYDAFIAKLSPTKDSLSELTGITEDNVSTIQNYIKAHKDAGDAIGVTLERLKTLKDEQIQDSEHNQVYTGAIQDTTDTLKTQSQELIAAAEAEKLYEEQVKAAAAAQKDFENALQSSNDRLAQLDAKSANDRANAIQSYNDTVANAVRTNDDAIFNAEQSLTDKIASLWQKLQNSIVDINSQLADKIFDINTQLGDKLADIQTQLSNKLADIQQSLANKLADLAHNRDQAISSDNLKIEQAARDLAEKLYEIERTRIEATNALDFNTGEQLRKAKTEHDREDILRRHQFEQGQIDQKANDDRHDAEQDFADKVAQANKEKELAKSTYDYQVRLAKELADQQIAQAEREAAQQRIVAQRQAQQQLAVAEREHDQALLLAERQYEQEKVAAVKSYNEQVAAAARAEAEKLADAKRALAERDQAIANSYALERAQILQTLALALWAYNKIIDSINLAQTHLLGFSQAYQNFLSDPLGQNPDSGLPHGSFPNIGGYGGLDMDVPAGHERDTFMIGARTGEHVTITPPGVNNSSSSRNNYFNIYGVLDPVRVRNEVASYLDNEAWR